jgi:hypothetical protein
MGQLKLVEERLRELIELVSSMADGEPRMGLLPTGNGLFISRLHRIPYDSIKDRVERGKLKWVAVLRLWQNVHEPDKHYNINDDALRKIDYLKELGVTVWPWAYPQPIHDSFCDLHKALSDAKCAWSSPGVIIDPEEPFNGKPNQADALMDRIADLGLVGVTSYGAPWYHQRFPFMSFSGADFSIPQTYDANNKMGHGYPQRSYDAWKQRGHKHIVGAFGTFRKTPEQLWELLKNVWETGVGAAVGWKWETTSTDEMDVIGRMAP